jgi:hypothetical protein
MGIRLSWVWGCLSGLTSPQWPRAAISPTLAWDLEGLGLSRGAPRRWQPAGSHNSKCVVPCSTTCFILCALLRAIKGQLCPARRVAGPPATDPSGPCGSASGPLHRLAQLYRPIPGRGSPGTRGGQLVRGLGMDPSHASLSFAPHHAPPPPGVQPLPLQIQNPHMSAHCYQ